MKRAQYKRLHHQRKPKTKFTLVFKQFFLKVRTFIHRVNEKGHERLTVMFIPHSEKKIFNFQISKYLVTFITILLITLSTYAIYVILDNNRIQTVKGNVEEELAKAEKSSAEYHRYFVRLLTFLEEMSTSVEKTNAIMGVTGIPEGRGGSQDGPFDITDVSTVPEEQLKNMDNLINTTDELKDKVVNNNDFLASYEAILKKIPSIYPVLSRSNSWITSRFGRRIDPFDKSMRFHAGVDIVSLPGTPIRATADGVIDEANTNAGYGMHVRIKHHYRFYSFYAHLRGFGNIKVGKVIKKGEIIGYMGTTGRSTGPHLHYEIRINDEPIDPLPFLSLNKFAF